MTSTLFFTQGGAVIPPRTFRWCQQIIMACDVCELDPWLLSSIIEQESGGGDLLTPKGPAGTGDDGHGHGLLQIDDRSHQVFLAQKTVDGVPCWQVPALNIAYGAQVLRTSLRYVKLVAPSLRPELSEAAGIGGYNAGPARVLSALRPVADGPLELAMDAINSVTWKGRYVRMVLDRRQGWLAQLPTLRAV